MTGAGITKNTERIESIIKTVSYRIPDELSHAKGIFGEVKNTAGVSLTKQIKDFVQCAADRGYRLN